MRNKWIRVCLLVLVGLLAVQGIALAADSSEAAIQLYMEKRAEMLGQLGLYRTWSMEEKATLDAYRAELGWLEPDELLHGLPGDGDLSQEEALTIAGETLLQSYGVYNEQIEGFQVEYDFFPSPDGHQSARWRLTLESETDIYDASGYIVEVESPLGNVAFCQEVASRLVPEAPWPYPAEEDDISPEEAGRIAMEYGLEHFEGRQPITPEVIKSYKTNVRIYMDDNLGRVYGVELNPYDTELFNYFGTFTVYIDPKTGIVWEGNMGNG